MYSPHIKKNNGLSAVTAWLRRLVTGDLHDKTVFCEKKICSFFIANLAVGRGTQRDLLALAHWVKNVYK